MYINCTIFCVLNVDDAFINTHDPLGLPFTVCKYGGVHIRRDFKKPSRKSFSPCLEFPAPLGQKAEEGGLQS